MELGANFHETKLSKITSVVWNKKSVIHGQFDIERFMVFPEELKKYEEAEQREAEQKEGEQEEEKKEEKEEEKEPEKKQQEETAEEKVQEMLDKGLTNEVKLSDLKQADQRDSLVVEIYEASFFSTECDSSRVLPEDWRLAWKDMLATNVIDVYPESMSCILEERLPYKVNEHRIMDFYIMRAIQLIQCVIKGNELKLFAAWYHSDQDHDYSNQFRELFQMKPGHELVRLLVVVMIKNHGMIAISQEVFKSAGNGEKKEEEDEEAKDEEKEEQEEEIEESKTIEELNEETHDLLANKHLETIEKEDDVHCALFNVLRPLSRIAYDCSFNYCLRVCLFSETYIEKLTQYIRAIQDTGAMNPDAFFPAAPSTVQSWRTLVIYEPRADYVCIPQCGDAIRKKVLEMLKVTGLDSQLTSFICSSQILNNFFEKELTRVLADSSSEDLESTSSSSSSSSSSSTSEQQPEKPDSDTTEEAESESNKRATNEPETERSPKRFCR